MLKPRKLLFSAMAVIVIAGLNLSTACHPGPATGVSLIDISERRPNAREVEITANASNEALVELTWKTLADVEFKDMYLEELDAYYWKPTFGASVKALEGKEVYITGYMIPVDYDEDFYVLSRYPFANCFFCGGAGPESVIDLRFKSKTRAYKTDERLTFKGTFKLNADDVYQMNYILEGAQEFKP
ncbi:MAG: hypothetical protein RL226_2123 [Bacteroidota bacterium]|jgi:hypothetical protein